MIHSKRSLTSTPIVCTLISKRLRPVPILPYTSSALFTRNRAYLSAIMAARRCLVRNVPRRHPIVTTMTLVIDWADLNRLFSAVDRE